MSDIKELPLRVNEARRQFELEVEGKVSKISYDIEGQKIYLASAVVPHELRNRGIAATLTDKVLHWVEDHDLKAVSMCSYITAYLHRHPEWQKVVV